MDSPNVAAFVVRLGVARILERNRMRRASSPGGPIWVICHGCGCEVDAAPLMSDEEARRHRRAAREAGSEDASIAALSSLMDDEPWVCATCQLFLP